VQLARVLMQEKAYRDAIPPLRAALEVRPDSGPTHRQLSIALVAIGDFPEAWKHLERALALGEEIPPPLVEELRRRSKDAQTPDGEQTVSQGDLRASPAVDSTRGSREPPAHRSNPP
jgi:tetratricopeptide (TPR) repeat protein